MKRNLFYILLFTFIGTIVPLASCNDEVTDGKSSEKWDITYVTLHPANYLKPLPSFRLTHSRESGVKGQVVFQYIVMSSRPAPKDITVDVDMACDAPVSTDKIELSGSKLELKAGQRQSEPITLSISDWAELENVKDQKEYFLTIKLKTISSQDRNISEGEFNTEIKLKIDKAPAL